MLYVCIYLYIICYKCVFIYVIYIVNLHDFLCVNLIPRHLKLSFILIFTNLLWNQNSIAAS